MRWSDLKTISATAALTMLVGVPLLLPAVVSAGPGDAVELVAGERVLEAGDCVVKARLAEGTKPQTPIDVVVTVENRGDRAATVPVTLNLANQPYSSPMSRMVMPAMDVWTHDLLVEVAPGETKTLTLATGAKVGNAATAQITARSGEASAMLANTFVGELPEGALGLGNLPILEVVPDIPAEAAAAPPIVEARAPQAQQRAN